MTRTQREQKPEQAMVCVGCNGRCHRFGTHRNGLRRFRCPHCRKTYTEAHAKPLGDMTVPMDKALLFGASSKKKKATSDPRKNTTKPSVTPTASWPSSATRNWF